MNSEEYGPPDSPEQDSRASEELEPTGTQPSEPRNDSPPMPRRISGSKRRSIKVMYLLTSIVRAKLCDAST